MVSLCLSSSSSFSLHIWPPDTPHPSSRSLLPPPPICAHHFHRHPTLKVQFALGALQKDGAHRVQVVVAVAAQGPSARLCDLEGTARVTGVRRMPLAGTDSAESAPSRDTARGESGCTRPLPEPLPVPRTRADWRQAGRLAGQSSTTGASAPRFSPRFSRHRATVFYELITSRNTTVYFESMGSGNRRVSVKSWLGH